jgi:hypothetical protein
MQDTGLFLSLAEIAGVFVGFGALIACGAAVRAVRTRSRTFAAWCGSPSGWSSPPSRR